MDGKNRGATVKGGILTILMIMVALTFLTSSFAAAENPGVLTIVRGKENAYNVNNTGDKPWRWYKAGDRPPIIMTKKVGAGAVVAAGVATSFEDIADAPEFGRWNDARPGYEPNPLPYLDIFLDCAFKWMVPSATKVLWYKGYGVQYDAMDCSNLVKALEALGYTITSDGTAPITADLLAPYDILVIPQLRIDLPDADVDAIKTFVKGGKGLFIAEGSDYGGANFYKVQNKILSALENELSLEDQLVFQSDEIKDPGHYWESEDKPIVDIDTAHPIGAAYQAAKGKTTLGLYRPCTLAPPTLYGVAVSIVETEPTPTPKLSSSSFPISATARPGENIVTIIRISNIGKADDNYTISADDDLGWRIEVPPAPLTIPMGEGSDATVKITVDPAVKEKVLNPIRITARGTGVEDTTVLSTAPYLPLENLPYPIYKKDEHYYAFSSPSLIVKPPAQPIMIGIETAYTEDQTQREPYPIQFGLREYPIAAAAEEIENGRVIVYGPMASFRSAPADQFDYETLRMKEIGPRMIGWLVHYGDPAQHKVLFYWTPTKVAFHNDARMAVWLDYLRAQGYKKVDTYSDGITPERLAPYSVLMITTPERALTPAEITAIKDWVHAGGGLFLGSEADYGAYGKPFYENPILEGVGVSIRTQDDEICDNEDYGRYNWEMRVYLVDHPVWYAPYAVSAAISPGTISVSGGGEGVFTLTIKNDGTEADNYRIEVTSKENWQFQLEHGEITLASGRAENTKITVTAPLVENLSKDDFTVVVTGTRGSASAEFRLTAEPSKQTPSGGLPWTIIAAAIVIVVVIAAGVYLTSKRS